MQKTKTIIALVAIAALTMVAVGLASAQISAYQTYTGTTPNQAPNNSFLGWIGNCFGYHTNQPYASQYEAPQAPTNPSTPEPAPYQSGYNYGYSYGYSYGPCWTR